MRSRSSSALAVLALTSFSVLLVACGGGDGGGDGPTGPDNQPPTVSVLQPAADTTVSQGVATSFRGSATDPEDGRLTGGSLVWESSEDGRLGTGETVSESGLSEGEHTVTLTATDSEGRAASDAVGVTVIDLEPVETLLEDPYLDALVADLSSSKRSAIEAALSDCDDALSRGDVPALRSCLSEARSEAGSASDPTDRALGASLDLLLAHAERQLES